MKSSALRHPSRTVCLGALGSVAVVAALSAGSSRAQAAEAAAAVVVEPAETSPAGPIPYADRFPNVVLVTHEGKNVRFYDDLLKGKIVLINFFYVTCKER